MWEESDLSHRPKGRDEEKAMKKRIRRGLDMIFLARKDGRLIGSLVATSDGRKGWVNRLAIHPDWRNKGIGTKLVSMFEERMDQMDLKVLCALVEDWNETSIEFFEKIGYVRDDSVVYFSKRSSAED